MKSRIIISYDIFKIRHLIDLRIPLTANHVFLWPNNCFLTVKLISTDYTDFS